MVPIDRPQKKQYVCFFYFFPTIILSHFTPDRKLLVIYFSASLSTITEDAEGKNCFERNRHLTCENDLTIALEKITGAEGGRIKE